MVSEQMDITHVTFYPNKTYLHVVIDSFSNFIWVIFYVIRERSSSLLFSLFLLQCFLVIGKSNTIKTDNGPAHLNKS